MASPLTRAGIEKAQESTREKARVIDLLRDYSLEITPREKLDLEPYRELLPPGQTIYITSVPGAASELSIAAAARLAGAGFRPVPHLSARRMASAAALEDFVRRAHGEAGTDDLLVIAGDEREPFGPYRDSANVLESGLLERHGIRRVGLAGYPGGHPLIDAPGLRAALRRKLAAAKQAGLAPRIVTQFCFEPERIIAWSRQLERERVEENLGALPIHIGLAGLASLPTLLKFAQRCGVAASLKMLRNHRKALFGLVSTAPDQALVALAAAEGIKIAGIHFFPFGGLARTVRWADAIRRGAFDIRSDGRGLEPRAR